MTTKIPCPSLPFTYVWPIVSKEGGLPGPDRYDSFKAAKGVYVNEFVMLSSGTTKLLSILMLVIPLRRRCIIL
jgi:hypothetical protein